MNDQTALETLRSYPRDTVVADLYDHDEEFASALNNLFGGTFEYPDHSYRKIGDVLKLVEKSLGVQPGVHVVTSVLHDGYAEKIISNNPEAYDALEIHGVRDLNPLGHPDGTQCEIDEVNPQFFSVYAHLRSDGVAGGGIECVGDFGEHVAAVAYAAELSEKYHYPAVDYSVQGEKVRDAIMMSSHQAEMAASKKPEFRHVDPSVNQTYTGRVMHLTDHHVVLSLGRTAAILERSMFKTGESIAPFADLTVDVNGGKAQVIPEKQKSAVISR